MWKLPIFSFPGWVQAPINNKRLGCFRLLMILHSRLNSAIALSSRDCCRNTLMATSLPRHMPRNTVPKDPDPSFASSTLTVSVPTVKYSKQNIDLDFIASNSNGMSDIANKWGENENEKDFKLGSLVWVINNLNKYVWFHRRQFPNFQTHWVVGDFHPHRLEDCHWDQ